MNIDTLTDAQIENLWRAGNDAGDGFPVGHDDDQIDKITELGDLVRADNDIAVYRGARGVVAVAHLHGPWAVIIAA